MDEQMIQQTEQIVSNPDPVQDYSEPDELIDTAPEAESYDDGDNDVEPVQTDLDSTEVGLNQNGDVEFGEDFFGNLGQDDNPAPQRYTAEELKNIPYEQWDVNKLEGDVRDYLPIVQEQIQRRQLQSAMSQRSANPPFMNAPKEYTPKELAEDAQKLACERLGLDDFDDFDEYEGEHRAAFNLAMQELANKRQAEVMNYQRTASEYQNLQRFNAEMVNRPDFMEFDRWFTGKLNEAGVTADQVNRGMLEYVKRNGGSYRDIQGVIENWYQEFRGERGGNNRMPQRSNTQRRPRPPVLESSGSGYEGRRSVNMSRFGDMDPDAQAQALIRMGIV